MKQLLICIMLVFSWSALLAQKNQFKAAGVPYTTGVPNYVPKKATESEFAIDTVSGHWYLYDWNSSVWNDMGERIGSISGCLPPAYTPGKYDNIFVINACDSLYYYRSGAWRHLNAGGGGAAIEFYVVEQISPLPSVGPEGSIALKKVDIFDNFLMYISDGTTWTHAGFLADTNAIKNVYIPDEEIQGEKLAQMGAADGQVLKWSTANDRWEPGNDVGGGSGDNWGTQVVITDATLTGNGTGGSPIGINQGGATSGQVLEWNGTTWAPATDDVGITTVGTFNGTSTANGMSISGSQIFLHAADGTNPGAVSTAAQTFAGQKTFLTDVIINTSRFGNGATQTATNTAAGRNALNTANTSTNTTAIGNEALRDLASGSSNTAIGSQAMWRQTSGGSNTVIGAGAMTTGTATTGTNNTVVGTNAMNNATSGGSNTIIGSASGQRITTGAANVILGYSAGNFQADGVTALQTPSQSIYIGQLARGFSNSDNNTIVIGANAIGLGANTTVIGSTATTLTQTFGTLRMPSYGSGTVTGTPVYTLQVTSNGSVIEGTVDGSGTNEGVLDVTAGGANDANITSNTSGSAVVNISGGTGIGISENTGTDVITITNTGDTNAADDITTATSAGGDLSGTYPNPTVNQIDGVPVTATGATSGQVLQWNGSAWEPATEYRVFTPVTAFGAAMDGTTNDATAIQQSLDNLGYAFFYYDRALGDISSAITSTITLDPGDMIFSNSRDMLININVGAGQYGFSCSSVPFLKDITIQNLTLKQISASGAINIFESRQVHILSVTFLGNAVGTTAINITGGDATGNAWNHIEDFLINDYNRGINMYTSGALNYCNRNFIERGTIQSTDTAIVMWRASTNMIKSVGCQNSHTHIKLKSAQYNTIDCYNETQTVSLDIDSDSYGNTFLGNVVETAISVSGSPRNIFLDANYILLSRIGQLEYANWPISSPATKYTHTFGTTAGSNDDLSVVLGSNSVVKFVEAGGNGSDYTEYSDDVRILAGNDLRIDGEIVSPRQTITLRNELFLETAPLAGTVAASGLQWVVPQLYDGWNIEGIRYSVDANTSTTNLQGRTQINGGANILTRNIGTGTLSQALTGQTQAIAAGDRLTFTLANGSSGSSVSGFMVTLTLQKL